MYKQTTRYHQNQVNKNTCLRLKPDFMVSELRGVVLRCALVETSLRYFGECVTTLAAAGEAGDFVKVKVLSRGEPTVGRAKRVRP